MQYILTAPWLRRAKCCTPLLILGGCLWLLRDHLDAHVLTHLAQALGALDPQQWLLAALFCGLSFWAVARYDGLAHRHLQTSIRPRDARRSGFAAIAIAQTAGFGVFTGAAVRWRMLPDLGPGQALRLSLFVSVTFMLALGGLAALAQLVLPAPGALLLPAIAVLLGGPALLCALCFAPALAPLRHRANLPGLPLILAILGWASVDLVCAALAFHILLPGEGVDFTLLLPAFLLALCLAMLSGTPGGVGPFEVTLIALLPSVPAPDLIAGTMLFRGLYYAAPALLGVALALTPPRRRPAPRAQPVPPDLPNGPAELGILAQNAGQMRHSATASYASWQTGQTRTMLFDPVAGRTHHAIADLQQQARAAGKVPLIYKCHAQTALSARRQGWQVACIAQDHVVDLQTYDLAVPARAALRRKRRKALKAGVSVHHATRLPLAALAAVDAAWQARHGTAQGGTMGRFCPTYLSGQQVFVAYRAGTLIAFVSFHADARTLCLDLMRHRDGVPDGTMHLLVEAAIDAARADGKTCVSLAATPVLPHWVHHVPTLSARWDRPGLRQFKSTFAPQTLPLYAAAPGRLALMLALADIAVEVHQPRPLSASPPVAAHKQHEDYEVDLTAHP